MTLKLTLSAILISALLSVVNVAWGAQEQWSWQIAPGDQMTLFAAKKSFSERQGQKIIEAQGNVVMVHQDSTVYGDYAALALGAGELELKGNVRFISKQLTLYGSHLRYQLKTRTFTLLNAKLFASSFSLVAHEIKKLDELRYSSKQAEFSACFDCPESWSVYGEKIDLTMNEYVVIDGSLLRLKGNDVLYLPYLIFPIKKKRQTGLLFPKISSRVREGVSIETPFFWAIDPHRDLTLTPLLMSERGEGFQAQYRSWTSPVGQLYLDQLSVHDRLYAKQQEPWQDDLDYGSWRFQLGLETWKQYSPQGRISLLTNHASDLDLGRDYYRRLNSSLWAPWLAQEVRWQEQGSVGEVSLATLWNKSFLGADESLHSDLLAIDERLVQKRGELQLASRPWLWSLQGSWGQWRSWTTAQARVDDFYFTPYRLDAPIGSPARDPFYRQARRETTQLQWHNTFLPAGPGPWWKTSLQAKNKHYQLGQSDRAGNVSLLHLKNSLGLDFEKVYGVARLATVSAEAQMKPSPQGNPAEQLLGQIPRPLEGNSSPAAEKSTQSFSAFRHSQQWSIVHEYLLLESLSGPGRDRSGQGRSFRQQLEDPWGWFDGEDALINYYYPQSLLNTDYVTRRPGINQVALQWTHSLVEKKPKALRPFEDYHYVTDQFDYTQVASASLFQGVYVDRYRDGMRLGSELTPFIFLLKWSLSPLLHLNLEESYYHQDQQHIFNVGMSHELFRRRLLLGNNLWFNDYRQNKLHNFNLYLKASERVGLGFAWTRDLKTTKSVAQQYRFDYSPQGRCWYTSLGYVQNLSDKQITLDFGLSFDGQQIGFTPPTL